MHRSEEELDAFVFQPEFQIATVLRKDFDSEEWQSCMIDQPLVLSVNVSKHSSSRYPIYFQCKNRYMKLWPKRNEFLRNSEMQSSVALVLAESLFWLKDYYNALQLFKLLDQFLGGADAKLTEIVYLVEAVALREYNAEIAAQEEQSDEEDREVFQLLSPYPCASVPRSNDVREVIDNWNVCKTAIGEALAFEMFSRYACVSSNDLENVFEVEGSTWHRLVRKGFFENSITGITRNSKIKNNCRIIKVLKNTNNCIQKISEVLNNYDSYTEDFICDIHSSLMEGENFETEVEDGVEIAIALIPAGSYRRMNCYTLHYPNGEEDEDNCLCIRYCRFQELSQLMSQYCAEARRVLNDDTIDIFMKAAWLQWAFLCIHPFGDGNGRVARIISSVPLVKEFLPPIVVLKEQKQEYFTCLDAADRNNDLIPLRDFLRRSVLEGIAYTTREGAKPSKPSRVTSTKLRTRERLGSRGSSSSGSSTTSPTTSPVKSGDPTAVATVVATTTDKDAY